MTQPQVGALVEMPSWFWAPPVWTMWQPSMVMWWTRLPVPPLALMPKEPPLSLPSMVTSLSTT